MSRTRQVRALAAADLRLGRLAGRWAAYAAAAGALGWLATAVVTVAAANGRDRFFHSYLVGFMFCLSLGLGALFFVLITHLTRAGWSVALRRLAEVVSLAVIPLGLLSLVLVLGRHDLYEWTDAHRVAADELLQHKRPYLNTPFFVVRLVFYFLVWGALALYFQNRSVRQDATGDPALTLQMERVAAPGAIFYAMTVTFASFDLLMSLYPRWYSTIYGLYYFAGSVLAAFSLITLLVFVLQGAGKLTSVVTVEHYHDLGKLLFAFVVFWAYVAFSQYMLIWYARIPEEAEWLKVRQEGPWKSLSLLLVFGHFVVPFLWLLSRHPKRRRSVLATAAGWLLLMHWFDLFWLVMPETSPLRFPFHLLDLTCFVALLGTLLAVVFWKLGQVNLVPLNDPRLGESLELQNV